MGAFPWIHQGAEVSRANWHPEALERHICPGRQSNFHMWAGGGARGGRGCYAIGRGIEKPVKTTPPGRPPERKRFHWETTQCLLLSLHPSAHHSRAPAQ